jgi:hypothetical protein
VELAVALAVVLLVAAITEAGETQPTIRPISSDQQREAPSAALAVLPGETGGAGDASQKEDADDPEPEVVDFNGTGKLQVVPGSTATAGSGPLRSFIVEVEGGLEVDEEAFADRVFQTLGSARGWGTSTSFRRIDSGTADFRVILAGPNLTDQLCLPHQTNGIYSCYEGGRAVINFVRWMEGADSYGADLDGYRTYLINHEVGHAIGHHAHLPCPAPGEPAPVMMQQTKGIAPCKPNPWP